MQQKHHIIKLFLVAIVAVAGCAKQGMPTGGPKDTDPPKVRKTSPANRTLHFAETAFYIEFDEYVTIKDAENNILVSPPMDPKPEYSTRGKGVMVKLRDTLRSDATYLFQFKNAIADYTEGNLTPSLEYVFSTGSYIDSMTIRGTVADALTRKPREEAATLWLLTAEQYDKLLLSMTDTAVTSPRPVFVTRSDKNGQFSFNYIQPGEYRIVAIIDDDKNMKVGVTESVAFLDTTVAALSIRDSVAADSVLVNTADSRPVELLLFTPDNSVQRITSSNFTSAGHIRVTTQCPLHSPAVATGGTSAMWRLNASRDTLTVWTADARCDSLQLTIVDSTGVNDTLDLRWRPTAKGKTPAKAAEAFTTMKINGKDLPYYDTLALRFDTPLDTAACRTDSAATVVRAGDSVATPCGVAIDPTLMKAFVLYDFAQGGSYEVSVGRGAFRDIHGLANDSTHASVSVTRAEDYGNLKVSIVSDRQRIVVVELLDERDNVVERHSVATPGTIAFEHIKPAKYRLRAICDDNGNGKWDTGDFATQRQPEKVVYLPKTLDIRANWDFEETLKIE